MKEDMTEKTVPLIWRADAWRFIETENILKKVEKCDKDHIKKSLCVSSSVNIFNHHLVKPYRHVIITMEHVMNGIYNKRSRRYWY